MYLLPYSALSEFHEFEFLVQLFQSDTFLYNPAQIPEHIWCLPTPLVKAACHRCQIFHSSAHHPSISDVTVPCHWGFTNPLMSACLGLEAHKAAGKSLTLCLPWAGFIKSYWRLLLAVGPTRQKTKFLSPKSIIYGYINVVGWKNISRKGEWSGTPRVLHRKEAGYLSRWPGGK